MPARHENFSCSASPSTLTVVSLLNLGHLRGCVRPSGGLLWLCVSLMTDDDGASFLYTFSGEVSVL